MAESVQVAIGMGSNLGDRRAQIHAAADRLRAYVQALRLSSLVETAPVGCEPGAPSFLNAAAVGTTAFAPEELLQHCQRIEGELGRHRDRQPAATPYHSRTIDLDLLLWDERMLHTPRLTVPHPRLCQREFVLRPLAELAPDWRIPPEGVTVAACLRRLRGGGSGSPA